MARLSKLNVAWDSTKGLCAGIGSVKARAPMTIKQVIELACHRQNIRIAGKVG